MVSHVTELRFDKCHYYYYCYCYHHFFVFQAFTHTHICELMYAHECLFASLKVCKQIRIIFSGCTYSYISDAYRYMQEGWCRDHLDDTVILRHLQIYA
jgi:hypothetical protein